MAKWRFEPLRYNDYPYVRPPAPAGVPSTCLLLVGTDGREVPVRRVGNATPEATLAALEADLASLEHSTQEDWAAEQGLNGYAARFSYAAAVDAARRLGMPVGVPEEPPKPKRRPRAAQTAPAAPPQTVTPVLELFG